MYDFLMNGLLVLCIFFQWPAMSFITSIIAFTVFSNQRDMREPQSDNCGPLIEGRCLAY